ncbi:TolC family protein [bacterium]|nr:TolC family protein [bacterium]
MGISKAAYAQAYTFPNPSAYYFNDTAQQARQIGASIPIEPPWKFVFRLLLAKSQIKQTDLEIQKSLWLFRNSIRRAYLDAVIARESGETLQDLLTLSSNLFSIASRRCDAGDVATLDVDRTQLAMLQAEADLNQAKRKVEQANQRLSVLLGRSYKSAVDVQKLPQYQLKIEANELLPNFQDAPPDLDNLLADALKNRLDIKIVQQSIAVNEANLRNVAGNTMPNPQLNVGHSYSGNPVGGPATRGFLIGVTQEIPVLNFQQADRARLKAINTQLKREFDSTKNIVTEDVILAYQQMLAARERLAAYQNKILKASNEVARLARRGYEVGQYDITATLAAQQANVQTRLSYLDAVKVYQQSMTDLEQAVGHPI